MVALHGLQRDIAVQAFVVRPVYDTHSAFADLLDDAVMAEDSRARGPRRTLYASH